MHAPLADLLTARLVLRELDPDSRADQAFILELLTQQTFIDNIGDRGVSSLPDACRYMRDGPVACYRRHGFGLLRISRRDDDTALGICGLLQREHLPLPDLGYALLDRHVGQGYAREAAAAVMGHAWRHGGERCIAAITSPHNTASIRLLTTLGFRFDRWIRLPGQNDDTRLFLCERPIIAD